jgi:hypothetical protein
LSNRQTCRPIAIVPPPRHSPRPLHCTSADAACALDDAICGGSVPGPSAGSCVTWSHPDTDSCRRTRSRRTACRAARLAAGSRAAREILALPVGGSIPAVSSSTRTTVGDRNRESHDRCRAAVPAVPERSCSKRQLDVHSSCFGTSGATSACGLVRCIPFACRVSRSPHQTGCFDPKLARTRSVALSSVASSCGVLAGD